MRISRLATIVVLLGASTASAVASSDSSTPPSTSPWSGPGALTGTSASEFPVLASDPSGPRAVYWQTRSTTGVATLGPGLVPGAGSTVHMATDLRGFGVQIAAAFANGRVAVTGESNTGTLRGGAAIGPVGGPLKVHDLPATVRALAANAAGEVAVLAEDCNTRACHRVAPSVELARPGRGFGRPIALDGKGYGYGAAVAINARGRVLAAWAEHGAVWARFISPTGALGPRRRLGAATIPSSLQAVLSDDGRAAVGWTSQSVSEGDATSPFTARVALAPAAGRFGAARVLDRVRVTGTGRYIPYQGLVVRLPAGQPGLAAWSGYAGGRYIVQAAPITGTAVGAAQTLSAPAVDTVLADAAEGSRGEAVVLMLPGRAGNDPTIGATPDGLLAATRASAAQPFGAIEQIAAGPEYVDGASVAIDEATGAAFATWRNVDGPIGWSVRSSIG